MIYHHHSTKQEHQLRPFWLQNGIQEMEVDILDQVEAYQKDSEDEESEAEDGTGESAPVKPLDVLRRRVEENLKMLCNSSPIDASPLLLSKLREEHPQVSSIFGMMNFFFLNTGVNAQLNAVCNADTKT